MGIKIGLAGVEQVCFTGDKNAEYDRAKKALKKYSESMGYEVYVLEQKIIKRDQAEEAIRAFKAENVDFILLQNSSFAAGETILPFAKTGIPLGLWAVPEPATKGTLPLNSLCGINMYASIIKNYLKEYDYKYKWFFGYPEDEQFKERLRITVKSLSAIKRIRTAKIALVGGIAPGFNDLYFDERLAEKRFGVNIQRNHEYSEIKNMALSYSPNEIAGYVEKCKNGYCVMCSGASEKIEMNARFLKAYEDFIRKNGYDAVAISCWPKIQSEFGLSACHTIAKLNEMGFPTACEGDLPGALSMLLLKYLSDDQVTTLLDLVAYDKKDDTLELWHCGPTAHCFADSKGVGLRELVESTADGGRRYLRYIHDMTIRPGAATVMSVIREFTSVFLLDGSFIDYPKDRFDGCAGWLGNLHLNEEKISAKDAINTIMVQGIAHHFPVVMGNYRAEIMEMCAWLGLKTIEKVPYRDYLQL